MLVTLREPVIRPATPRDRAAARAAIADYTAAFERLDGYARQLRADGWIEGADLMQQKAETAYFAAAAERRHLEGEPT